MYKTTVASDTQVHPHRNIDHWYDAFSLPDAPTTLCLENT